VISSIDRILRRGAALALAVAVATALGCDPPSTDGPLGDEPPRPLPAGGPAPAPASSGAPAPASTTATKTDLFHKTFGKPTDRAVVFLHGGPGANSFSFEGSVAEALAARGNFVVTYDQRGSGRSPAATPQDFTFKKVTQDLDDLIHALGLKSPILIGHSWGGTLAVKFLETRPAVAKGAVLVGNPVDHPDSIFNIHERCAAIYKKRLSFGKVQEITELNTRMFPSGLKPPYQFSTEDFEATMKHALGCGLDFPSPPTLSGTAMWARLLKSSDRALLTSVEPAAGASYQINEHLLYAEFSLQFRQLRPKLYGIYGDEDGLFSEKQTAQISSLISPEHFTLVHRASHFVYIDQQEEFLTVLTKYLDALAGSP
jgi:proline iminopeptidase